MKDFKYLTSSNYPKKNTDEKYPSCNSTNLRRSFDLKTSKNTNRPLKTANGEQFSDSPSLTSAFPYFRPRSPLSTLARSLQISKFSKTLASDSPSSRQDQKNYSVFQNSHFIDIVNPQSPFKGSFLVVKKSEFSGTAKKRRFCHSIEITRKVKISKTPKLETVNIKDIKDKKWLIRKNESILRDFYNCLNKSNGIKILKNLELAPQFKYFIGKGNNSKLVKSLMTKRHGWGRLESDDLAQAHFIWTEWLDDSLISILPTSDLAHTICTDTSLPHFYQYKQSNLKRYLVDTSSLNYQKISSANEFLKLHQHSINPYEIRVYNKIKGNHNLSNKKELFANLERYCNCIGIDVFEYIPISFHIVSSNDEKMNDVKKCFDQWAEGGNVLWIVKPGEDTNRGSGIVVCNSWEQIKREVGRSKHTSIVQKYIENPFLVSKRKFDIRVYCLITCFNGILQGYYYNEGYLRTSSKAFSLNLTDKFIHLTNDAVQKRSEEYGKYENGNKMSYNEFQKYLDLNTTFQSSDFTDSVLPKIKQIISLTIKSTAKSLLESQKNFTFEVLGYDFILDSQLKPWLLEANTNPCLEISSSHLARIIPNMLDNALQISIDSIFQTISLKPETQILPENRFELVYHSQHPLNFK